MMSADVTLNCVTKNIKFIAIHAKANTSPTATSYARRKAGADSLHAFLNTQYPEDNIIILGDLNDDLDVSITAGFSTTSWDAFTTDGANYSPVTLPLSLAGKKSTVGYNDVIDHVIISNELAPYYMPQTANILTDVTGIVTNYANTTSDHYPVFTRYKFETPLAPIIWCNYNIDTVNSEGLCSTVVNYNIGYGMGCGEMTVQQTTGLPSGSAFPVGITTNTFVVIDEAGGSDTCSFTVTVRDTTNPVIACPAPIVRSMDPGVCGSMVNYTIALSDNCDGATIEQTAGLASGSLFPVGTTTNIFVATDESGNTSSCSFTVTVSDQQAPSFSRPADISIPFTSTCSYNASTSVTGDVVNETDNCSVGLHATYIDEVTSCGNNVTILRTWSLVDNYGNAATNQVQRITVTENNTSYIVFASKEAKFAELNYINGSVGVSGLTGKAEFKLGTVMPSAFFAKAKTVTVHSLAYVPNRIKSPALDGPAPPFFAYSGNTAGLPNRTITASSTTPVSANYKELKIKKNVTITLTGTLYGKIDIEKGAQVTFAPSSGIINMENLKVTGDNNAVTRIKFSNCTSVRVKDKVEIGEFTQVNVNGPKLSFYLGDANNDEEQFLVSGNANAITANVYVLKGELRVKGDLNLMNGLFITEKLISEGHLIVWNDNNCTTPDQDVDSFVRSSSSSAAGAATAESETSFGIMVSPNPSSDQFVLRINSSKAGTAMIRVTDASGKLIELKSQVGVNTTTRLGSGWTSGLYFAEVIQGNEKRVIRLVKVN
jgi:hypothetical protein